MKRNPDPRRKRIWFVFCGPFATIRVADGYSYYILDIDGLMRTKQSVRPKDKMDMEVLRRMKLLRNQEKSLENSRTESSRAGKKKGPER